MCMDCINSKQGLKGGWFSIDIPDRKATLYSGGTTPIDTATVPQVGRTVAKLLSLPIAAVSTPSLEGYKNKFVYIRSVTVSQRDMLVAAQRATGTTDADWTVDEMDVDEYISSGKERLAKGDRMGLMGVIYGATFKKGLGNKFHGQEVANKKLGVAEENVDEVVKRVVKELQEGDVGGSYGVKK